MAPPTKSPIRAKRNSVSKHPLPFVSYTQRTGASKNGSSCGFSDACWVPFLVIGMLLTGSANTLSKKVAYQTESDGQHWRKPWTCTLVMFTGELMCTSYYAS